MRLNDRLDGSIKALLILGLIIANLVVASFPHSRRLPSPRERSGNDEIRMPKPESMTRNAAGRAGEAGLSNDEARDGSTTSFVIGSFLRTSSFEFRH